MSARQCVFARDNVNRRRLEGGRHFFSFGQRKFIEGLAGHIGNQFKPAVEVDPEEEPQGGYLPDRPGKNVPRTGLR